MVIILIFLYLSIYLLCFIRKENNNWLGWGWKLSPLSDSSFYAIDGGLGMFYRNATGSGSSVFPTIYLKSSIDIISGYGSTTNPYILG